MMVIEKHISTTTYACSLCMMTYSQKEDAEKCESRCVKLSKSPDISTLGLSSRTYNILKIAGIDTIDEVLGMPDKYLLKLRGFGQVCLRDLHQKLQSIGDQNGANAQARESLIHSNNKLKVKKQELSKIEFSSVSDEYINRPLDLPEVLKNQIIQFVGGQDWITLYKDYQWHNDTWENGFPDILRLETQMRSSLQNGEITKKNIQDVAYWGKFLYPPKVTSPESIPIAREVMEDKGGSLLPALISIKRNVEGIGPTYLSKILRFAFPNRAGALDSRIVRVFGMGDSAVNQYQWLSMRTHKLGSGWAIYRDRLWPLDYEKWLQILTKMVSLINDQGVYCPHPQKFLDSGMRTEGIWICADVEMAIVTYVASKLIKK